MPERQLVRTHLVIATPGVGAVVHQRYMQSICLLMQYCQDKGIGASIELITHDPLQTRAHNTLVAKFMDRPTATHLLFVDASIGFLPAQVQRLLDADKDIVAGVYPQAGVYWNDAALERVNRGEALETAALHYSARPLQPLVQDGEYVETDFAEAGFMLIKRDVFTTLFAAYPQLQYRKVQGDGPAQQSPHQYALFEPFIERLADTYYCDSGAFCQRWRKIGGQIWIDTASELYRIGPLEFFASPKDRYAVAP